MPDNQLFSPVEDRRVFKEILVQLDQAIVDGRIGAGDRLPSERELAQQFGVARTSVREALRVLEALGVVQVRPGADHGATLVEGPGNAFRDLLQFQLALRHISIASLVEFRYVIESWAAGAAATRASKEALGEVSTILAAMKAPTLGPAEFQVLDASFHLEIARLSANELLMLILEGARNAIERVMLDALTAVEDWESVRRRLVREHGAILSAITGGESARASSLMRRHIERFYAESLSGDRVPSAPA
jgi:GntR family transcriptional repressor for pyruvate dehydrogenase complex